MDFIEFWTVCSSNGIVLDKEQMKRIERFHDELIYWNKQVNLISRQDESEVLRRHILHSLSSLRYIDLKPKSRCLDIGTGGGFPGIPLKIAMPDIHMLLIDSIGKKIKITGMLAKHTGLRNIEALNARAESLQDDKKYVEGFDFIFSRAVGRTNELMSWARKLIKPSGKMVFYKGGNLTEEIEEAAARNPEFTIAEVQISLRGEEWFEKEEKKLVIVEKK